MADLEVGARKDLTARAVGHNISRKDFAGGWIMPDAVGKIYKHRGDRYFIRLKYGQQIYCDKQQRGLSSKKHCEWTLAQIAGEIENGTFDPSFYAKKRKSLLSFSVYATQWLANCERRLKRGDLSPTYLKDLRRFVKIFVGHFGDKSMLEIKGREIKNFYFILEQHPKTVFNIMAVLHKLFRDALEEEVIGVMPNFPKQGNIPEPDWHWCDVDIQDRVLNCLDDESAYFILFMMTHGTRTGETRALKHGDIDIENNIVTIRRSFSGTELRETTKTRRTRILPLDPTWKELYLSKPPNINPHAFIFTKNGQAISESWMRKQWNKACMEAGVPHIKLYEATRHSLASQAANRGESLYLIQRMLGHTNAKMTARYSHVETNALKQIQRKPQKGSVCTLYALKKPGS